jgi:putative endonuclease
LSTSHRLGLWGENTARVFLELCGYHCLDQRFRRGGGEIDLVVRKGDTLVFVEVKTRGPGALAPPEAWLNARQMRRLRRLALQWLAEHESGAHGDLRFDLVAIQHGGADQGASIQHLVGVG